MASSLRGRCRPSHKPETLSEGRLGNGGLCQLHDSVHKVHIQKDSVFISYRIKISCDLSPLLMAYRPADSVSLVLVRVLSLRLNWSIFSTVGAENCGSHSAQYSGCGVRTRDLVLSGGQERNFSGKKFCLTEYKFSCPSTIKMKTVCISKTVAHIYQAAPCHIPEDSKFNS
jgi:hypothetical protein